MPLRTGSTRRTARQTSRFITLFVLFQKSLRPEQPPDHSIESEEKTPESQRIRCPLCEWQPDATSRWHCSDCDDPEGFFGGCGAIWNTFDTGGLCPGCQHQWCWTACLRCHGWSLHQEWYTQAAD